MAYRDELAAAQARASAAERELMHAREQQGEDGTRLASLERSLAAALREIADLRDAKGPQKKPVISMPLVGPPARPRRGLWAFAGSSIALAMVAGIFMMGTSDSYEVHHANPPIEAIVVEQAKELPAEFAPRMDVDAEFEKDAKRVAQEFGPGVSSGPFLTRFAAQYVDDDGLADLSYGSVGYTFSVSYGPLPPAKSDAPLGAIRDAPEDLRPCSAQVIHSTGMTAPEAVFMDQGAKPCGGIALDLQCSVAEVRQRSIAAGAPTGALAQVFAESCHYVDCDYDDNEICCKAKSKAKSYWDVQIIDRGETLFWTQFADNCPK